MEAKNIMSDTLMVAELAQELGISPLDLFMYWINTGEIKNVSISVVFQNEEEIKVDFCQDTIEEIINQSSKEEFHYQTLIDIYDEIFGGSVNE